MHVTDFKACTIPRETAWPEGRKTALVSHFGKRVRLIHELRELRTTEEVADDRAQCLRVDQLLRRHDFDVGIKKGHALFHQTLRAGEAHAALVGEQFTHGPHATGAEMINIVEHPFTDAETDDVFDGSDEVVLRDHALFERRVEAELHVDLVATDARQIVFLRVEEKTLQQRLRVWNGWWVARAEAAVDVLQRLFLVVRRIFLQRFDHRVILLRIHDLHGLDAEGDDLADGRLGERLESAGNGDLTIADVRGQHLRRDLLFIEVLAQLQVFKFVENLEHFLVRAKAQRAEESRRQNLPPAFAAVEVCVKQIVRIKLELHPRTAIRNDAERIKRLPVQVNRAFKANARRAMELRNDNALRAIDHKRAGRRHQRDFAHIHLLLLRALLFLELEGHVKRRGIRQTVAHALTQRLLGLGDFVAVEIQRYLFIVAGDRENLAEHRLKTRDLALADRHTLLQEFLVRIRLQFDEIWRLSTFLEFTEVLAFRHRDDVFVLFGRRSRLTHGIRGLAAVRV